jgi:hypothetical protein
MNRTEIGVLCLLITGGILDLTADPITTANDLQLFPQVIERSGGGYLFCWDDNRDGQFEVYTQDADSDLSVSGEDKTVSPTNDDGHTMTSRMIPSGSGAIIAWTERINIFEKILANDIILNSVLEGYKKVKLTLVG